MTAVDILVLSPPCDDGNHKDCVAKFVSTDGVRYACKCDCHNVARVKQ